MSAVPFTRDDYAARMARVIRTLSVLDADGRSDAAIAAE